ncbi:metallo-beta-lactamase superfamily protein [Herbihabitans rhizosphaerae]|uniref:Metallo-beta-lactamase superfamily protein n=1 Tax=Herbihabitans rhizosphaerae TaxID=1872711 RepID=A0A4Q7KGN1_9PSEU|nr:MBL fold metallo-hydrolase [Herbihabitans rhizosphaerae]RZS34412.1 metallo-beta-lactamase superfamily protein [Herbihabitans rhizosphaerae]
MTNTIDTSRLARPSGIRTIALGDLEITYLPDGAGGLKPRGWFADSTAEDWAANPHHLDADGMLVASFGALLVAQGNRALLVDAGLGPLEAPGPPGDPVFGPLRGGALLDSLAEVGRSPSDIEAIAVTHLHPDHIGWAAKVDDDGRPVFDCPVVLGEQEWTERAPNEPYGPFQEQFDALEPRVRTVVPGEEVFPGVEAVASVGHTPGHLSYRITSGGHTLIVIGDAMHSPLQIGRPEWSAAPDSDPTEAVRSRRELIESLREPNTLGFGVHFADVVFGRVVDGEAGPVWQPLP